jgi:hypothetical protein
MYGHVRQITPEELNQLQRNPESVEQFLFGKIEANTPAIRAALERVQQIAIRAKSNGQMQDPAEIEKTRALILNELSRTGVQVQDGAGDGAGDEGLSLEKSWHALHYLLTGTIETAAPPLGNAILGGEEIGEERDYGRVRFLTPEQVGEVARALGSLSKDDLVGRFDVKKMKAANVIYPCRDQSEFELAQHYFEQLSRYYADAAASGSAILLWLE